LILVVLAALSFAAGFTLFVRAKQAFGNVL
jgi:hypothetical protein